MTFIARQSSLEIGLRLFSPTYSTTMLIDRSGAFTASEADVFQTGCNVQILHLELDYFLHLRFFCKKSFLGTLISLKRVKSQCFDIAVSYTRYLT